MYSVNTVLLATCVINFVFIHCQRYGALQDDKEEDEILEDHHSFVALIDIVFTDGSKRTCTGTIVHDNAAITAAHCFNLEENENAKAELTASFVVIGTKHLFETGYEQYLPIERVITHPKFKDWNADLALVYTFAGMTSDKPGTVIPLAGERTSTPVESNVTVISWGRLKDNKNTHHGVTKVELDSNEPCLDTASHEKFDELTENTTAAASLRARPRNDKGNDPPLAKKLKSPKPKRKGPKTKNNPSHLSLRELRQRPGQFQIDLNEYRQHAQNDSTTNVHSKYLNFAKEDKFDELQKTERHHYKAQKLETNTTQPVTATKKHPIFRSSKKDELEMYNIKSFYKNWRRQMGTQQNKLNVETFGFVNTHTCKRFLESAAPHKYQLKGANDVVCYSTEEHYITDKDSGAPAIRQGRLVAVTIGGIECDGEHVAIGMKMNCYCSWIMDNLPHGSSDVSCCRNCCDIKHGDSDNTLRLRNKYI